MGWKENRKRKSTVQYCTNGILEIRTTRAEGCYEIPGTWYQVPYHGKYIHDVVGTDPPLEFQNKCDLYHQRATTYQVPGRYITRVSSTYLFLRIPGTDVLQFYQNYSSYVATACPWPRLVMTCWHPSRSLMNSPSCSDRPSDINVSTKEQHILHAGIIPFLRVHLSFLRSTFFFESLTRITAVHIPV